MTTSLSWLMPSACSRASSMRFRFDPRASFATALGRYIHATSNARHQEYDPELYVERLLYIENDEAGLAQPCLKRFTPMSNGCCIAYPR